MRPNFWLVLYSNFRPTKPRVQALSVEHIVLIWLCFQSSISSHWQRYCGHGLFKSGCGGQLWYRSIFGLHHHCPVLRIPLPGVPADGQIYLPSQVLNKKKKKNVAIFEWSLILLNFLFVMLFLQWIPDQVWEPAVREECCISQRQKDTHSWFRIPSSPGELEHVQEGFRLQLVEKKPSVFHTPKCFTAFRDSSHTSGVTKQVVKKQ